MNKTKIEWADYTWNPVTGCFHDCPYCYAKRIAVRFGGASETHCNDCVGTECQWFTEAEHKIHVLDEPIYDYDSGRNAPYPYEFDPTFHRYRLNELKNKSPQKIFVCSMADLFGEWVPWEWIDEVFKACIDAPQHTYMFLTKNPRRLCELKNEGKLPEGDNFWWGSTITRRNSLFFAGDITDNIFLSVEPILEPLNANIGSLGSARWIIIGAETGRRKGKVVPKRWWIDNICKGADDAGIAVFMKDSLISIVGEENMRREWPAGMKSRKGELNNG